MDKQDKLFRDLTAILAICYISLIIIMALSI